MANKTIALRLSELTGITGLKLRLLDAGTLVNTGGDTLTETSNGWFSCTVTEAVTAKFYDVEVVSASDVLEAAGGKVYFPNGDAVGTYVVDDPAAIADAVWDEPRTGHDTVGTFGYLFSGITLLKNWLALIMGKTADTTTRAEVNATTAGATYNETTDSQEAIRDRGDSAWTTGGDALTGPYTRTFTINDGSTAIQSAKVRIYRTGYTESKLTNASGQVSFTVDAATWSVSVTAAGFTSQTNSLVVSEDGATTYSLTAFTPTTPTEPDTTVVSVKIVRGDVSDLAGITVQAAPYSAGTVVADSAVSKIAGTATTDSSGECEIVVPRASSIVKGEAKWKIQAVSGNKCVLDWLTFDLVEDATISLGELTYADE